MNRLRLTQPAPKRGIQTPPIISVLSGKGGVGKSVLAFNLAERAAAQKTSTLLVDADFSGGNLHILANCACGVGIAEFIDRGFSLNETITPVTDNLDLLGASHRYVDPENWSAATVARILARLRREAACYDLIVIDHSSGKSHTATLTAHGSDINLLAVVPELTSISDCYGLFKHLQDAPTSIDCRLLINRIESAEEADYLHKKFGAMTERFLGQSPRCAGFVFEDAVVRQAVGAQKPLSAINSESPVTAALSRMAQGLIRDLTHGVDRTANPIETSDNVNPAAADIRE